MKFPAQCAGIAVFGVRVFANLTLVIAKLLHSCLIIYRSLTWTNHSPYERLPIP